MLKYEICIMHYTIFNFFTDCIAMSVITDSSDLEREYSPSQWSMRFVSAQDVLHSHIQTVTAGAYIKPYG